MEDDVVKTTHSKVESPEDLVMEAAAQIVLADGLQVEDIVSVVAGWGGKEPTTAEPPHELHILLLDGTMIHAICQGRAQVH